MAGVGDRTFKLDSGTASEYGPYVKSLREPRGGRRTQPDYAAMEARLAPEFPRVCLRRRKWLESRAKMVEPAGRLSVYPGPLGLLPRGKATVPLI